MVLVSFAFCIFCLHSSLHTMLKAFHDASHQHEDIQGAPDQVQDQNRALDSPLKVFCQKMLIILFLFYFFKAFILLNECWRVDFSNVGMIWSTPWCVRPWQSPQPVPFPWLCCWSTHSCCVQYFGKISFGCCLPAPWDCLIITWSSSGNNRARNHSNIWYSVYRL